MRHLNFIGTIIFDNMSSRSASKKSNIEMNDDDNCVSVSINPSIYPLDVIYSAAYVFLDRAYVFIDGDPQKNVVVELKPKDGKTDLETLGRELNNELLNYAVYKKQV